MKTQLVFSLVLGVVVAGTSFAAAPEVSGNPFFINGRLNIKCGGEASAYLLQTRATDDDDWTNADIRKSGSFIQTVNQDYTGKAQWRLGNNPDNSEWVDFGTLNARCPQFGDYFSNGKYNDNCTADKAFDGDPATYYEPGSSPYYVGVDFGEKVEIGSIAYVPRNGFGDRVASGWIEGADNEDFSDAKKLCTLPSENASYGFHIIYLPEIVTNRYVRFRTTQWMNIAELEVGKPSDEAAEEEADLSEVNLRTHGVVIGDEYCPAFDWNPVAAPVTLKMAESADGPWTEVSNIAARVSSCEFKGGAFGRLLYFRLVSGAYQSAVVEARHLRRIPTDGAVISWQGKESWGAGPGTYAFDGDAGTWPNLDYPGNRPKLVVSYGAEGATNHIARMLLLARNDGEYNRINGVNLYGSTRPAEVEVATDTLTARLTPSSVSGAAQGQWSDAACDATFCYPTYVIQNCGWGNVAEVKFYGWYDGEVEGESEPTAITSFTVTPYDVADFKANLSWNPVAGELRVERSVLNGPWKTIATVGGPDSAYVDTNEYKVGLLRSYRLSNASQTTGAVSYRKMRRLDVSAGTIFANGEPYDGYGNFERAFDGDISTRVDLWGVDSSYYGLIKVGVDFGSATNFVGCIRAYPRKDGSYDKLWGMTLYGGTRDAESEKALNLSGAVNLSPPLSSVQENTWHLVMANDLSGMAKAYRTYFIAGMTKGGGGCVAELEFYGWTKDDARHGIVVFLR